LSTGSNIISDRGKWSERLGQASQSQEVRASESNDEKWVKSFAHLQDPSLGHNFTDKQKGIIFKRITSAKIPKPGVELKKTVSTLIKRGKAIDTATSYIANKKQRLSPS